jgi:hypothetical protein
MIERQSADWAAIMRFKFLFVRVATEEPAADFAQRSAGELCPAEAEIILPVLRGIGIASSVANAFSAGIG